MGVKVTETVFRDGHQSLLATRMRLEDMLPMAEKLDSLGYYSMEVWGGATFDTCMRYLDEDPWERLRVLKAKFKKTPLQMLLRGQNLVGYHQFADDVVDEFVARSVENGIDIFRIFDALNDVRNLERSMAAVKKNGAHVQGTVVYTISPVHDVATYLDVAKTLVSMGADSLCIKDMAGLLDPYGAQKLIGALKDVVNIPIHLHCHYTSGLASMTYLKAIEAGVDGIDTAISALALGSSQPATETMIATLKDTPYATGIDLNGALEVNEYMRSIMGKYVDVFSPRDVNTGVLAWQVPGGMISNLWAQMIQQGAEDKTDAVLQEIIKVREEIGYPPLVTPMSQIVGTQAVVNILTGQRYGVKSKEIRDYVRGLYGKPPRPISAEVRKMIIGKEEIYEGRPADRLPPQLETAREEIKNHIRRPEDVLSYIMFPKIALEFWARTR